MRQEYKNGGASFFVFYSTSASPGLKISFTIYSHNIFRVETAYRRVAYFNSFVLLFWTFSH